MEIGLLLGTEADAPDVLDFAVIRARIVVTRSWVDGKTLKELSESPDSRGVFVRRMLRLGQEVPLLPETRVNRGDAFEVVGSEPDVTRVGRLLGRIERESHGTDMTAVGMAIVIGGLIGLPQILIGPLQIGMGTSVGALLGGVIVGWLHSRRPNFGQVPAAALDLMRVMGLAAFVGMVGMQAGPHFFHALLDYGVAVVLAGGGLYHCAAAGRGSGRPLRPPSRPAAGPGGLGRGANLDSGAGGQIVLTLWGAVIVSILA